MGFCHTPWTKAVAVIIIGIIFRRDLDMEAVMLSRWQFAITTIYHFLFVPVTLGMAIFVALLGPCYVRTKRPEWKKTCRKLLNFFGTLFLINFAMGVVTGLVQEFQFGMNWSEYSRFMGDIFGAPLALEALTAFFLESTFLGIWMFGWDKLSEKAHCACIWLVAQIGRASCRERVEVSGDAVSLIEKKWSHQSRK